MRLLKNVAWKLVIFCSVSLSVQSVVLPLAVKHGYTGVDSLKNDIQKLSSVILKDKKSSSIVQSCQSLKSSFCEEVNKLAEFQGLSKRKIASRKRYKKLPRFTFSNLYKLQKLSTNHLISNSKYIKNKSIGKWYKKSITTKSCPRNMSLALAYRIENNVQEANNLKMMNKLFSHWNECGNHKDDLHLLRAALFSYVANDKVFALKLLRTAEKTPKERQRHRVYYWLYKIYSEKGNQQEADKIFAKMKKEYLLSWYTIKVAKQKGFKIWDQILKSPIYSSSSSHTDLKIQNTFHWFQFLTKYSDDEKVVNRFGDYFLRSVKAKPEKPFLRHVSEYLHGKRLYRLKMFSITYLRKNTEESVNKWLLQNMFPKAYFDEILVYKKKMDPALIAGLIKQESAFEKKARSPAGAVGLMQLLPSTAKMYNRRANRKFLYNPKENIKLGVKFFTSVHKNINSAELTLLAYNAGYGNFRKWKKRYWQLANGNDQLFVDLTPFFESREYVNSILRNVYWYKVLYKDLQSNEKGSVYSQWIKDILS